MTKTDMKVRMVRFDTPHYFYQNGRWRVKWVEPGGYYGYARGTTVKGAYAQYNKLASP